MKRWTVILITLVMMTAALPAQAEDEQRAMWVWEGPSAELLVFSIDRGIDRLFLHSPPGFSSDPNYGSFLDEAHAAGLEVFALAGDPSWAKRSKPFRDWVDEVVAHSGFDGIAPDIEPYALSDWSHPRKRARVISSYLDSLEQAKKRSGNLPLMPAVPFWWDLPEFDVAGAPLIDEVMARVDGVAVMAYRDQALAVDGIVEVADYEVSLGTATGKQVMVGVETAPVGLDKVSFYEEGNGIMEQELAAASTAWAGQSGHWGYAIHHYGSYLILAP